LVEKVVAIIPAKNEEKNIGWVVEETKKYVDNIVVIDDGSTDMTHIRAREKMGSSDHLITHPTNYGKGRSVETAAIFLDSFFNLDDNDIVVMIDSDRQHLPSEIPRLLKKLRDENLDMVLANRDVKSYPLFKRIGNKILSIMTSLAAGKWFKDSETGFRCIRYNKLVNLFKYINPKGFQLEAEMNVASGLFGYKIGFIDVGATHYRHSQTIKSGFKNGWSIIKTWIKLKIKWLRW